MLITTLDIVGTFAFAITGCFKAIKHELDILGLMTGIGGGIMRDCILGVQPAALSTNVYFSSAAVSRLSDFADVCHDYCNSGCQAAGAEDEFWLEEAS